MTLATRVAYVGDLSLRDEFDLSRVLPLVVIDGTFAPAFGPGNRWLPGESVTRVFRPGDERDVLLMDTRFGEPLFEEICSLSGLHADEMWACGWRIIRDGQWQALFVLAEKLGMTIHEICERMPSYELTWWLGWLNYQAAEQERAMAESKGSKDAGFSM